MPRKLNKKKKFHIKKGDTVKVITGEDKGSTGKVLDIIAKSDRVLVEGVNMRVKHHKPSQQYPQGGRLKQEAPIHISNVMPLDPVSGEATRIGRKRIEETGKSRWVRYSKESGEVLDK